MGICASREKPNDLKGVSSEENYVYRCECELMLNKVQFKTFDSQVRKFSLTGNLNEEHLKIIAPTLQISIKELHEKDFSAYNSFYRDSNFIYQNSRYSANNLLKLGFLLCVHGNTKEQEEELWTLANPELSEKISKQTATQFLHDLAYIAVDANLSFIKKHLPDIGCEIKQKLAQDYLEKLLALKDTYIAKIAEGLDEEVEKQQFIDKTKDSFFNSYDLRMAIDGKKREAVQSSMPALAMPDLKPPTICLPLPDTKDLRPDQIGEDGMPKLALSQEDYMKLLHGFLSSLLEIDIEEIKKVDGLEEVVGDLETAVKCLTKLTPDVIGGAMSLINLLKNLQKLALKADPNSQFAKKLLAFNQKLANPITLNAKLVTNLAMNPVGVTDKILNTVMSLVKGDVTSAGPKLGDILSMLTK